MKFLRSWRVRKPEEDSESVYISEKFGVRTLHIGSDTVQSSMRISKPNDLEVTYTRSMMAFLLFKPEPRDVLMIGLGGDPNKIEYDRYYEDTYVRTPQGWRLKQRVHHALLREGNRTTAPPATK